GVGNQDDSDGDTLHFLPQCRALHHRLFAFRGFSQEGTSPFVGDWESVSCRKRRRLAIRVKKNRIQEVVPRLCLTASQIAPRSFSHGGALEGLNRFVVSPGYVFLWPGNADEKSALLQTFNVVSYGKIQG